MKEMFRHLISNAIKFAKNDTPLQIRIGSEKHADPDGKEYVMISIADTESASIRNKAIEFSSSFRNFTARMNIRVQVSDFHFAKK